MSKIVEIEKDEKVEFIGVIADQGLCEIPQGCLIGLFKVGNKKVWIEDILSALSLRQLVALHQRIQYEFDRWLKP